MRQHLTQQHINNNIYNFFGWTYVLKCSFKKKVKKNDESKVWLLNAKELTVLITVSCIVRTNAYEIFALPKFTRELSKYQSRTLIGLTSTH